MEFGTVYTIPSKYMNNTVVVYKSFRKPGYVITFNLQKGNAYRCCRCRELGKQRVLTIVNDVVVGQKNPEDDHHTDCELVKLSVHSIEADRTVRNELNCRLIRISYNLNHVMIQVYRCSVTEIGRIVFE